MRLEPSRQERAAKLAEGLARIHGFAKPPVLPEALLEDEPVVVFGEDFANAFDGRLEYDKGVKYFGLYYNTYGRDTAYGRSRFSLAHETAHYFIDEHRRHLEAGGNPHYSKAGFQVDSDIEREADVFAANLLMPRFLIEDRLNEPDIDTVIGLAGDFKASLMCSARRFIETTYRACTLVISRSGRVQYSIHSEQMAALGYVFVKNGLELPRGRTIRRSKAGSGDDWTEVEEKLTSSREWSGSDRGPDRRLWMETVHQPRYEQSLTLLIYESDPGASDEDDEE